MQQQLRARHNCAALSEQQLQQLDFASQLQSSCTTKGRLLYYPPPCSQAAGSSGEWCSWHKDFGSLTGEPRRHSVGVNITGMMPVLHVI